MIIQVYLRRASSRCIGGGDRWACIGGAIGGAHRARTGGAHLSRRSGAHYRAHDRRTGGGVFFIGGTGGAGSVGRDFVRRVFGPARIGSRGPAGRGAAVNETVCVGVRGAAPWDRR